MNDYRWRLCGTLTYLNPVISVAVYRLSYFPGGVWRRAPRASPPLPAPARPSAAHRTHTGCHIYCLKRDFAGAVYSNSISHLYYIWFSCDVHVQVDYKHCLVPDLQEITACSFYWGKMDRYEAERLLENKPEGM